MAQVIQHRRKIPRIAIDQIGTRFVLNGPEIDQISKISSRVTISPSTYPIGDEVTVFLNQSRQKRVRVPGERCFGSQEAGSANVQLDPLILFALNRILRRGRGRRRPAPGRGCSTATIAVLPVQIDRGHFLH